MRLRVLKRIDDFLFVEELIERGALSIIIIPKRNLLVFWAREETKHERVTKCKRMRNGLYVCWARLSL